MTRACESWPPGWSVEPEAPTAPGGADVQEELLTINFGPHHPATHGVLRLLVTLRGEEVLGAHPYVGYVHTGIEKSCEDKSYWKVIPLVERMDYLAYYFNAMAFCMAVERCSTRRCRHARSTCG